MSQKSIRLLVILCGLGFSSLSAAFFLVVLNQQIVFFRSPSDLQALSPTIESRFQLGGLVQEGSVVTGNGTITKFTLTDGAASTRVEFDGLLPDLFSEGQGIIARGKLQDGLFIADSLLAKHDETYMPREIADALRKNGTWKGE